MKFAIKPKRSLNVKGRRYRAGDENDLVAVLDSPEALAEFLLMCADDVTIIDDEGQGEAPGRAPAPIDGEGQAPADDGQRPRSRPARRRSPIEGEADV